MTSEERKEARYQRRKAKRLAAKRKALVEIDDFDKVFTFKNLYASYKKCKRNVTWKSSVQKYSLFAPLNVYTVLERLRKGRYKSPGFFEFDLFERGKKRHIRSTVIGERVVQRCLCDYALVPALERTFIYDNGISQVLALASANELDHAVKELMKIKQYERYMDDGMMTDVSKKRLIKVRSAIFAICDILEITMNEKKTQIVKLSHGFTWLKVRFFLPANGKIIRKICKASIKRCRKKLKKLYERWRKGLVPFNAIYQSFQSWYGYARRFNAWHTRKNMVALYNSLLHQAEREDMYGLYQIN